MKKYFKILVAVILLWANVLVCTSCLGPIFGFIGGDDSDTETDSEYVSESGKADESDTEDTAESESVTETEAEADTDTESDTDIETETETETNTETETETESEADMETESERYVDLTKAPERYGISSADITKMVEGLADEGLSMHSVLVMRHGEVIAEGYAEPFDENSFHRLYSTSKSFVAIAIGVLEAEGKISIYDTIDKYFPEYVTDDTDPRIAKAKIVDLLRMMSPYDKVASCGNGQEDWIYEFFNGTPQKDPGTTFKYDTGATHILGTIVERETGMDFLEYLKQEALLEIGFSEDAWCIKAPEGYAWGGSGVMCTSRDLALFANLVMNKGEYNGKQLLPREYVEAATSYQVSTAPDPDSGTPFYGSGYGYQIWMNPYGFAFMGMGNQFAYCIPDKDLIIVCTADNQGNSDAPTIIYEHFEKYIIKKVSDKPLADDRDAYIEMLDALENMEIPYVNGKDTSKRISIIDGKTYVCNDSNGKISSFVLDFNGDEGVFTYDTPRGKKELRFGIGKNVECILNEPQYYGDTIGTPNGKGYRSYCSGAWKSDAIFVMKVQVIDDYFGNMTLTFNFSGASPKLTVVKSAEWFLDEYKMTNVEYTKK